MSTLKSVLFRAMMLCMVLSVVSCRTARLQKSALKEEAELMLSEPSVTDLSGRFSVTYGSSGPFTVRARMRWNKCIHLSYNALGLMEVCGVDILPNQIVLVNRLNGTYSTVNYSDIPYLDGIKVDFLTVQGILWNRIFVYGMADPVPASGHIDLITGNTGDGGRVLADDLSDFRFNLEKDGCISRISKTAMLYKASAAYSGKTAVSQTFSLPSQMNVSVVLGSKSITARLRYSGFSSAGASGEISYDQSELDKIPVSEMLKSVKKYL